MQILISESSGGEFYWQGIKLDNTRWRTEVGSVTKSGSSYRPHAYSTVAVCDATIVQLCSLSWSRKRKLAYTTCDEK